MNHKDLELPDSITSPPIRQLVNAMEKLEQELADLRKENKEFIVFAETARFLEPGLKAAICAEYDNEIYSRKLRIDAIQAHLAQCGYSSHRRCGYASILP